MKSILIVDNDQHILKALRELALALVREITLQPTEVLTASSAAEVLHIVDQCRVNLLIVDHYILKMNGLELMRAVSNGPIEMAKVLIADDPLDVPDLVKVAELGFDSILIRPLKRTELKALFRRLL
jgi:DNA-binding response OmpR family regulator